MHADVDIDWQTIAVLLLALLLLRYPWLWGRVTKVLPVDFGRRAKEAA